MGRKVSKYDVNLCIPTSDEELKKLRKKVLKAIEELMKGHIENLQISDKEKKNYYDNVINNILNNKEIDQK